MYGVSDFCFTRDKEEGGRQGGAKTLFLGNRQETLVRHPSRHPDFKASRHQKSQPSGLAGNGSNGQLPFNLHYSAKRWNLGDELA